MPVTFTGELELTTALLEVRTMLPSVCLTVIDTVNEALAPLGTAVST